MISISYKEYNHIIEENALLKSQIAWLKRNLFGCKSDTLPVKEKDPDVLDLFFDSTDQLPLSEHEKPTEEITYTRKKRGTEKNRVSFPDSLERYVEVIELPQEERVCDACGTELVEIGEEVTEELEIIPAKLYVKKTIRKKYACKNDSLHGVWRARLPKRLIPKGIAGPQLIAHILVSKYVDHLPLHRQEQMFARLGHRISKSTMSDWLAYVGKKLDPLLACLKNRVQDSRIINGDETTYKVQQSIQKQKLVNGYLWTYVGDRKWVWYEWHPDRTSDSLVSFLKGCTGEYFQSDGYTGYASALELYNFNHLGCWAHARRKFVDEAKNGSREAEQIVQAIAPLYGIEKELRELAATVEAIHANRQEKSKPLLEALFSNIEILHAQVAPKSNLGKACAYVLNRKRELSLYLTDGELSIDNNIAERAIRPIALGRKNWLFSGSEKGAENSAGIFSLVETCKLHNINVLHYFQEVLKYLPDYEGEDMMSLLPDAYAMKHCAPEE